MNKKSKKNIFLKNASLLAIGLGTLAISCQKSQPGNVNLRNFEQVNLVANSAEYQPVTIDPTLLNAFGIAWSPGGTAWVNSVGGHVSELYTGDGAIARTPVNIPSPADIAGGGLPCGIVFSGGLGFNLPDNKGAAAFIFSGFDGVISGWNGTLSDNAIKTAGFAGAAYTGLAIAANNGHNFIYGANFGGNRIDVWDTNFKRVSMSFKDPLMPNDYSPYNIQAIDDKLFVMYAQLTFDGEVPGHAEGAGKGFVSVFNTDGSFVKRFASRGTLDIPWGITLAPASFLERHDMGEKTKTANDNSQTPKEPMILVGNFGDGRINVFSLDGKYFGQLQSHDHAIVIDGLWALSFAPSSATTIDPARLYFSAGPDNEADGLFGYLNKK